MQMTPRFVPDSDTCRRTAKLGIALALPALLSAQQRTQNSNIDLSPITDLIASFAGAFSAWFPWIVFIGFLGSLIGAAFHSRRRIEWLGGAAMTVIVLLVFIIGKLYINRTTNSNF